MENFTYFNPTVLHFGRNILSSLGSVMKEYGRNVLFVYGRNSVKTTGLYGRIMKILQDADLNVVEYGGIKPNPIISDVDAAARIGRSHKADMILAVGGGSVIDSAKIISITIPVEHPAWDFYTYQAKPKTAIPLISVLTLAATGSEMNPFAVLQNNETGIKSGYRSDLVFPRHSFLDPELTITVPRDYTAFGIADLIAHSMEAWFGAGDTTLIDRFIVAIIHEAMEFGPRLLKNLHDYDLRARIMFAATQALNCLTLQGKVSGDWGVHSIGHCLSYLYDVPHGASLTIVYPAWLRYFKDQIPDRIALLGSALFEKSLTPDDSIKRIEDFFRTIDCPVRLSELSIPGDLHQHIYETMVINKVNGANIKIKERDYSDLIDLFL
jgi:alcohol dehydrogenase YqhD (iron-dependent ADH family)